MNTNLNEWKIKWQDHLPEPYRGLEPGNWPRYSVVVRLPEIGERVLQENSFSSGTEQRVRTLINAIPNSRITELTEKGIEDVKNWNEIIREYRGCNWLEVPWFFAEFYFYRRIMEAIGYFERANNLDADPFQYQKSTGFLQSLPAISRMVKRMENPADDVREHTANLSSLILFNLLGNQVDLSLWPVEDQTRENHSVLQDEFEQFIVNDLPAFIQWFITKQPSRVDFLIDNAGFELLSDFCLMDYLLRELRVQKVVLHVKPYPMFVSDVLKKDVYAALQLLKENTDSEESLVHLSKRLNDAIKTGRMEIMTDSYWGLPLALWQAPDHIFRQFESSDLIVSKGDANYRRILGDRQWGYHTPFEQVAGYLPGALLVLRIVKSNAGVGYPEEHLRMVVQKDPDWMKNGEWGSVQFWDGER